MCNDCHKKAPCVGLSPSDCFQMNEPKCDVGCEHVVSSDCVFQMMDSPSAKLPHIGVNKGASQLYINKKFDEAIGGALNSNFVGFNLNGLSEEKIDSLKLFVDASTKRLKELGEKDVVLQTNITNAVKLTNDLGEEYAELNNLAISNSKLNINNTDDTATVIKKLVVYLDTTSFSSSDTFVDSDSISWGESESEHLVEVKVSDQSGNTLKSTEDGLYVGPTGVSETLKLIENNPILKKTFSELVQQSLPAFRFDILAYDNTQITYVNNIGVEVIATAKANELLQLKDVRQIKTTPSNKLFITFKGI